jgi:hypothetical protein
MKYRFFSSPSVIADNLGTLDTFWLIPQKKKRRIKQAKVQVSRVEISHCTLLDFDTV